MQRFIDLAGGAASAKLVYIPCEEREHAPLRSSIIDEWQGLGVAHTALLHTKDRQQANSDESFLAPLVDATGISLRDGTNRNFADSYYGTRAHGLMKQVLLRGGVIGGSSAGGSQFKPSILPGQLRLKTSALWPPAMNAVGWDSSMAWLSINILHNAAGRPT